MLSTSLAVRRLVPTAVPRGFTLIELAVVLVIVGVLLAVWSYTVPWVEDEGMRERSRAIMVEARQALVAFARTNHRLPCPDTNSDGFEDCTDAVGGVPFETLLLSAPVQDARHAPITYAVYRNAGSAADLGRIINLIDTMDDVGAGGVVASRLDSCDFCEALRNGSPTAGSSFASVSTQFSPGGCGSGAILNQAFVLASSGLEDRDGSAGLFDGDNASTPSTCFASPQQGISDAYDDIVIGVGFQSLIGELCRSPVCLGPNPVVALP